MFGRKPQRFEHSGLVEGVIVRHNGSSLVYLSSVASESTTSLIFADALSPKFYTGKLAFVKTTIAHEGLSKVVNQLIEVPDGSSEITLPYDNFRALDTGDR